MSFCTSLETGMKIKARCSLFFLFLKLVHIHIILIYYLQVNLYHGFAFDCLAFNSEQPPWYKYYMYDIYYDGKILKNKQNKHY